MSDAATRQDIDEVIGIVRDLMQSIDARFNNVETQLTEHSTQFRQLNTKYDHLISTIDGFLSRIDKYEIELAARDSQFERLLDWARKVSEKTGIPLENL